MKMIQAAFSHGVISRESARMYAKVMCGDYYHKFTGVDSYCADSMLMRDNAALRREYLELTQAMHKITKPHFGKDYYDEETRKWIKARLSVAKRYIELGY